MTAGSHPRAPRPIEIILVIAIVMVAIIFRFAYFTQVPPGLHYDEAIDAKLAQDIRSGAWPIYFEAGWGREPLYHYLVALTLNFISDPATALRFVSGTLGVIQLLAAYLLYRQLFGRPAALIGAMWIAVLFWTVSTSRAGLRNITLTTFATLTAWAFWKAWGKEQGARGQGPGAGTSARPMHFRFHIPHSTFIIPGILLGLTLYTYQPGRVAPLIYAAFVIYLAVFQRASLKAHWKALAVFFVTTIVIAAPLIVFLATHPNAEAGRAFQTEPVSALLHGDPGQVINTTVATLKMFTFEGGGDPQILYNISGRPLFIGLGSLLFYFGLIVGVIRIKRPAYAFLLIWLIVTLLPNLLTAPAPFFYRAIAAQAAVLILPAIGTVAIGDLFHRRGAEARGKEQTSVLAHPRLMPAAGAPQVFFGVSRLALRRSGAFLVALTAVVSLGQTAVTTWHDYFDVWGSDADVRFQYSAAYTAIAHALDASDDTTPVAISGYFIEDADPIIFDQTLHRRDLSIRWFDAREALVAAQSARDAQRLAVPSYTPLDDRLKARFLSNGEPLTATKEFKIYAFNAARLRGQVAGWNQCGACPVAFDGNIELLNIDRPDQIARASNTLSIMTAWQVLREGQPSSTAIFVHLLDPTGRLAAQAADRLGVPRHTWQPGDEFVQVHRIPIADLPSGKYTLEIGLYDRDGGTRWMARDRSGYSVGDHVLCESIEVTP